MVITSSADNQLSYFFQTNTLLLQNTQLLIIMVQLCHLTTQNSQDSAVTQIVSAIRYTVCMMAKNKSNSLLGGQKLATG